MHKTSIANNAHSSFVFSFELASDTSLETHFGVYFEIILGANVVTILIF